MINEFIGANKVLLDDAIMLVDAFIVGGILNDPVPEKLDEEEIEEGVIISGNCVVDDGNAITEVDVVGINNKFVSDIKGLLVGRDVAVEDDIVELDAILVDTGVDVILMDEESNTAFVVGVTVVVTTTGDCVGVT